MGREPSGRGLGGGRPGAWGYAGWKGAQAEIFGVAEGGEEFGAGVELEEPLPGVVDGVDAALGVEDAVGGCWLTPEGAAEDFGWVGGRGGGGCGDWGGLGR